MMGLAGINKPFLARTPELRLFGQIFVRGRGTADPRGWAFGHIYAGWLSSICSGAWRGHLPPGRGIGQSLWAEAERYALVVLGCHSAWLGPPSRSSGPEFLSEIPGYHEISARLD